MIDVKNPTSDDFWLIPLGGTGEIGMNLNLYGHDGQWLIVDCGISFEDKLDKNGFNQSQVIMPDITFAKSIKTQIIGIVITHAHEDHIGALPYLWEDLGCPIYATAFTRQVLLNKLNRAHCPAPVVEYAPASTLQLGPFSIKTVSMTHSTPETQGLIIETPKGRVFHTADWKLDADPVVGLPASEGLYNQLGHLDAVITDSTNALEPNAAISEAVVQAGLYEAIKDVPGRVVVSCFASNIARLQSLGTIAAKTGRYLCLLGYSLEVMHRAAKASGYLLEDFDVIDAKDIGYLPANEVLVIATGSQGQPGSALHRLAMDQHADLNLKEEDQVILSSKTIPGNEKGIELLLKHFAKQGVTVLDGDSSNLALHGSGHGGQPELLQLFEWTKPTMVIPVHGEPKHLAANAELAKQSGIEHQLIGENGDLFNLIERTVSKKAVYSGKLSVDSTGQLISLGS